MGTTAVEQGWVSTGAGTSIPRVGGAHHEGLDVSVVTGAGVWVGSGLVWAWSEGWVWSESCMSQPGFSQCTVRQEHEDGRCRW